MKYLIEYFFKRVATTKTLVRKLRVKILDQSLETEGEEEGRGGFGAHADRRPLLVLPNIILKVYGLS